MFQQSCRNSVNVVFTLQKKFLVLLSRIAVDSFFQPAIAFVLLRSNCFTFTSDKARSKVIGNRTQKQGLRIDQGELAARKELRDDAPLVFDLAKHLKTKARIFRGGINGGLSQRRLCLKGTAHTCNG